MEKLSVLSICRHRLTTDGKGVTSLIALSGCPLHCQYCLNRQILSRDPSLYVICTPQELVDSVMIDYCYFVGTGGGITFGGGESLLQARAIHEVKHLLPENVNVNLETCLNVPNELLTVVADDISEFIIDIKDMNPDIYRSYTGRDNTQVLDNLTYLADKGLQDRCRIRIPQIPEYNTAEDIQRSAEQVLALGFTDLDVFQYVICPGTHPNAL